MISAERPRPLRCKVSVVADVYIVNTLRRPKIQLTIGVTCQKVSSDDTGRYGRIRT